MESVKVWCRIYGCLLLYRCLQPLYETAHHAPLPVVLVNTILLIGMIMRCFHILRNQNFQVPKKDCGAAHCSTFTLQESFRIFRALAL